MATLPFVVYFYAHIMFGLGGVSDVEVFAC
jgi:hypothetical protein